LTQIVSDVHGAFDALASVARLPGPLLILGDLINLTDYRTGEGIAADVLGLDVSRAISAARARGDYARMRRLWTDAVEGREQEVRSEFSDGVQRQYEEMARALEGAEGYVTFGNVDNPHVLAEHLPDSMTFVDGDVIELDGFRVGVVGGGIATPLGAAGEVSDEDMASKLDAMGPVDVLCSHLPPAIRPLYLDVVTGRPERASEPIRDYLERQQPLLHLFGDVHQPQASTWRVGGTVCRNVGYFRATRRSVSLDLADLR
jgi:Icc-related predicted phosphoesterase